MELVETLDDLASGITEQQRLHIVPLSADGVEFVVEPEAGENVVLGLEEGGEIDEDDDGLPGDRPTADANAETFAQRRLAPTSVKVLILYEIAVAARLAGDVRTDADVIAFVIVDDRGGLRGKHRVDAADLVANLPTGLENVIRFLHLKMIIMGCKNTKK